jgi:phosphatidylglycerophosphate synthase
MSEGHIGLVYRQFSLPLSWLLVQTRITANQISVLWMVLGLAASACLATGTYGWAVLGALLLQLVAILDRVDGEIARHKQTQSMLGLFWDLAGHILIKSFLFIGISLGLYRTHADLRIIFLGISAASSLIIGLNLRLYERYILLKNGVPWSPRLASRSLFRKLLRKLENIWWTLGLFGIILAGALLNQLYYVLLFYGIATPFWALSVLIRAAREVQTEDDRR